MTDQTPKEPEKRGTAERYTSTVQGSNLRIAEHSGAGDMLIAAGWSPNRLGAHLMRLQIEFTGISLPRRMTLDEMHQINAQYKLTGKNVALVYPEIQKHYVGEVRHALARLRTFKETLAALTWWVRHMGIQDASLKATEMLAWWLDSICPTCEGRKKQKIAGSPHLSHRDCKACRGTGQARIPHDPARISTLDDAHKIHRHIDVCLNSASAALKGRMAGNTPRQKGKK